MTVKKLLIFTIGLILAASSGAEAKSKRLLYDGNYDGAYQKVYMLSKKLVREQQYQGAKERLF